jgi:hypothetical protein
MTNARPISYDQKAIVSREAVVYDILVKKVIVIERGAF